MNSKKYFWRNVAYALAAINLLFWAWSIGSLNVVGFGPKSVQESHRLDHQVEPELLTVKPAASLPASGAP